MGIQKVFFVLLCVALALVSSLMVIGDDSYTVTSTGYITFTDYHDSSFDSFVHMIEKTKGARQRNNEYILRDEEIEDCIEELSDNWERRFSNSNYEKIYDEDDHLVSERRWYTDGFLLLGYDEDIDFGLRWRLRNKWYAGEELC